MAEGIKVNQGSKIAFSRLLSEDGLLFFGMPDFPAIDPSDDDIIHEVEDGDRIDNLSATYYGRPDRGWIIAVANGIDIYPNGLNTGDELRIPSPQRVEREILPLAARGRQGRTN